MTTKTAPDVPLLDDPEAPLYERLERHVAGLIEAGTLRPGDRVPSVRKLSRQMHVSVSTVLQAYARLESRGLVQARPQSGYYVRSAPRPAPPEPAMTRPTCHAVRVRLPDVMMEMVRAASDPRVVPLGAAISDTELMPVHAINRTLGRIARREPNIVHGYDFPPGRKELRRQIARRAIEAGCGISPDEVVVTSGAQEALNLCLRAVAQPGDAIAVETPTFYGTLQAIESLHLRALEIPTYPREGPCLDSLEELLKAKAVRACLFVLNFANPLGSMMPDEKKRRLVEMLTEYGVPLIEDDIYGELPHGPERPKAAKAFDHDGVVLWCSSLSKTLSPGLRIGWVAPGKFHDRIERLKFTATIGTPAISQLVAAEFLENGGYDRHVRAVRRLHAQNVARMIDAVGRHFPQGTCVTRPEGGYVLWVEMPRGVDAFELNRQALARRISTAPGPLFSAKGDYRHCVRLNCGLPWTDTVEKAVATLGRLASRQLEAGAA